MTPLEQDGRGPWKRTSDNAPESAAQGKELVIVTGISGAGKAYPQSAEFVIRPTIRKSQENTLRNSAAL